MTNTTHRKTTGIALALAVVLSATAVFFHVSGYATQEKTIPDHGSFTECRACHQEKYKMWEASRHSKSGKIITQKSGADCIGCHTPEGFAARLQGTTFDPSGRESFNSLSCVACHKPGSGANPKQLVMDPKILCGECHAASDVLEGKGATGLNDVRSFHSAVTCVSCHMPEANHNMKIVRPDASGLPEDSTDTCSRCHKDSTRDTHARHLQNWRELYRKAREPIEADLKMITAVMKEKPDLLDAGLQAKLSAARANLFLLQRDSAQYAHNLDFALEIARQASKDIEEIKEVIKRDTPSR